MADFPSCTFGVHLKDECHKQVFCRSSGIIPVKELKEEEIELLRLRTQVVISHEESTICFHHQKMYLHHYEGQQRRCCDPWMVHKATVRGNLASIKLETVHFLRN